MNEKFKGTFLYLVGAKEVIHFFSRYFAVEEIECKISMINKNPKYVVEIVKHGEVFNRYICGAFELNTLYMPKSNLESFDTIEREWIKYVKKINENVTINNLTYEKAIKRYFANLFIEAQIKKENELKILLNQKYVEENACIKIGKKENYSFSSIDENGDYDLKF